eukprot:s116_g11.t1
MVTVDSGSAVTCFPEELVEGYPVGEHHGPKEYTSASNHAVKSLGSANPVVGFEDYSMGKIEAVVLSPLKRPLFSTGRMVRAGWRVVHDLEENGGSFARHRASGRKLKMYRMDECHFGQSGGQGRFDRVQPPDAAPMSVGNSSGSRSRPEEQPQEMEDEVPELEVDEEESHSAGIQRTPILPSQSEIDEHNVTHVPFRAWCPFCIRGRGLSSGHFSRRSEAEEQQVPTISVDYMFLGDESTRDTGLPVLVVRDRRTKAVWAHPVPAKGVENPFGTRRCGINRLQTSHPERKPELARWDGALLAKVKGVPWNLRGQEVERLERPLTLKPEVPEAVVREPEPFRLEPATRNLYIIQKNLEKYGYTAGCPACASALSGKRRPGTAHTAECRARLEKAVSDDPVEKERYDRALMKAAETELEIAEKRAKSESAKEPLEEGAGESASGRLKKEKATTYRPLRIEPAMSVPAGVASTPADGPEVASPKRSVDPSQAEEERGETRVVCEEPDFFAEKYAEYYDDISGRELDPEMVVKARREEVEFIRKMKVWQEVDRPKDKPVLKGRWVDINKGDEEKPQYRSRYVGKEIKKGSKGALVADFFAAMPPLSSFKLLLTLAMVDRFFGADGTPRSRTEPWYILFIDVKRAHFVSDATRELLWSYPETSESGVKTKWAD